ncbi:MAG: shikimate kinase [Verrucomicrobiota bacterium]|nr:shikimate kinase [Verrucomicrobiota bacterium]
MERGDAIVLIGFMGSGKSSVGRELAARTGLPCYDTDEMVANRYGLPIAQIFARFGEDDFRAAEMEALTQLPASAAIIVTGGGVVLRAENVATLRRLGIVIHLLADEETLFTRVSRRKTRPLLQTKNPRTTLSELLQVRVPHYQAAADRTVDTSALRHAEVAELVLQHLAELRAHVG